MSGLHRALPRNRGWKRMGSIAGAASLLLAAGTIVASADTIVSGDNVTKAPGSIGSFQVWLAVDDNATDPTNGCNAAGSDPVTISFSTSNASVAAAPSSVQLTDCGVANAATVSYAVLSGAANGATTTITASGSGGKDGFYFEGTGSGKVRVDVPQGNFTADSFTITVTVSNTAPTVSVTGFNNGDTFEIGQEPAAGCSVVDAEDTGESAAPVVDTSALAHGMGLVSVTCSYTDGGGLQGSDTRTYKVVDTTDPTIGHTVSPASPNGNNGWYTSAPTVTFTCSDTPGSGIQSCVADLASPASASYTLGESASAQSIAGTATDWAGNTATDSASGLNVDLSDPTNVRFTGDDVIKDAGQYPWGFVPATPGCTADDAISGLGGCVVTGEGANGAVSNSVGSHTLTATATDNAGRTSTATLSYTVTAWTFGGFYQPVDNTATNATAPVYNVLKGGQTVPIKFELFAGATELTNTSYVDGTYAKEIACSTLGTADPVEATATGGTSLRYDTTGGQYVYNWQSPKTSGKCYAVTVNGLTGSGASKTAYFQTK